MNVPYWLSWKTINSPGPEYKGLQGGDVCGHPGPVTDSALVCVFVVVSELSKPCVNVIDVDTFKSVVIVDIKMVVESFCSTPNVCVNFCVVPWPTVELLTFSVLYTVVVPPPFPGPD